MTFDLNTAVIDDEQEQKKKQNQGFDLGTAAFEDGETPKNNYQETLKKAKPLSEIPEAQDLYNQNNSWIGKTYSQEQLDSWKQKGPIGFFEAFNKYDKLDAIPVTSGITSLAKTGSLAMLAHKASVGEQLSDEEKTKLSNYMANEAEIQTRGYAFGGKAINATLDTIPFIGEFLIAALTAGGATPALAAEEGTKIAAKKGLKVATRELFEKLATKEGALAIGKNAATAVGKNQKFLAPVLLPSFGRSAGNRFLTNGVAITDKGEVYAKQSEEAPAMTILKAIGDAEIGAETELAGAAFAPLIGGVAQNARRVMPSALVGALDKLAETKGAQAVSSLLKRGEKLGFHGFLEEMGENELQNVLSTTFDLDPEQGYSFEQFGKAIVPTWDDFLITAGLIAIQGGMSVGAIRLHDKLVSRGLDKDSINEVMENTSELEKDDVLRKLDEEDNTFTSMKDKHITDSERENIEKDFYDKAVSANRNEAEALATAKLVGTFAKKYGSDGAKMKKMFNDLELRYNQPLEGGVSVDVPAENNELLNNAKNTKDFAQGDLIKDLFTGDVYEVIEPDKKGMAKLKNVDTDEVETWNAHSNERFSEYEANENEYSKSEEFVYDPKAKDSVNAKNYVDSKQEVTDAYNEYIKNPTEENSEKYEEIAGKYSEEYSKIKNDLKSGVKPKGPSTDNAQKTLFQKNAAFAGATKIDAADAAKEWKEKGTDSPYFQKWFGDSKAIDLKGKPLVVYHGSPKSNKGFDTFNGSDLYYFAKDRDYAEVFADEEFEGQVYGTYLSIKKPLDLVKYGTKNISADDFISKMKSIGVELSQNTLRNINDTGKLKNTPVFRYVRELKKEEINRLKELGYDGIIQQEHNTDYRNNHFNTEKKKTTAYIAFSPEQIKSVDNQGTFSKETGNIYKQFAGQKAETADRLKLQEAIERLDAGENPNKVRMSTGWFKGVDGKLRFEISDKDAVIRYNTEPSTFKYEATLGEFLKHDKLFAAYPELVDIDIKVSCSSGKTKGRYGHVNDIFGDNNDFIDINVNSSEKEKLKEILMHEIQHYIQREEKFAAGGDTSNTQRLAPDVWKKIDELNAQMGELVKEHDKIPNWEKTQVQNNEFREKYDSLMAERNELNQEIFSFENDKAKAYDRYKRLSGEVEARQVMSRVDMDDFQRKVTHPLDTMDIHPNNQVVVFDDGTEVAYDSQAYFQKQNERDYLGYFKKDQDKNIIGIMENAKPDTLVHEMGHLFLQGLNEFAKTDEEARRTLKEVNNWLGYSESEYQIEQKMKGNRDVAYEYTEAQHEKFAEGFTAYLYNGKAPSNALREVFENFKNWLHSIFQHVDELGIKLDADVKKVFDTIFSEKSENEQRVKELLERVNGIGSGDKLTESQKRHKEVAYDILSYAIGKNKQWLKTILESTSDNPKILKSKEKIQEAVEHVEDAFSGGDGFLPEWSEFFSDPGVSYDNQDVGADYLLAQDAYDAIINQGYKTEANEYAFLDTTEAQYQYLVDQFKKSADRDIPLAAYWEWIETVEPEFQQTYIDKYQQDTTYIERFEKMDKFEQAKETILKAAREANSPSSMARYREIAIATMDSLKFLTPRDKAKLTANILRYETDFALERQIDQILDVAQTMEDVRYKMRLMEGIHEELQGTKNIKQSNKTVGKYDYTTNKIFERLREIDALTQEQANELRLEQKFNNDDEENGIRFEDKIINSYIAYKANGIGYTSTEAAKVMYDDVIKMKLAGKDAKSHQEFENKLYYANEVKELVKVLDEKKVAKVATKAYLRGIANWESMLNGIFNNKIKEKYSLLRPQREADTWIYEQKKDFEKKVAEIYGKQVWNFDQAILKNLETEYTFLENIEDIEKPDGYRQVNKKMNKMEVLLAWVWDYNDVLHERLVNQFGAMQLNEMFNHLTLQDKQLGNLMMHKVNSFYPKANEKFIRKYGIDLPKVDHYFPSKVERISEIDLLTDFSMKSNNPSFIKNRSGSAALSMAFDNPVKMLYQHIDSMGKFIHMTETLDTQNKIFKSKLIKGLVTEKYGEDSYNEMLKMFMNNSYKQEGMNISWYETVLDKVVSNWLIGNVAIKPSIMIKQLLSSSNYASPEGMTWAKWVKGYAKAWKNPSQTIEYMKKIPYLKARFEAGGQNEFLKNEISNSKLAKVAKLKEFATMNIRLGDIGAIAFGGKPYLEYLINEKKLSEDAAVSEFLDHTQRTMQASETSTLNNFQISMNRNKYGGRLLTAYKNAQWQYLRMAGDSIVSYANGDISSKQMAKTLFIYMFLNPLLYRTATSLSLITLAVTGSSDDLMQDVIGSIFDLNADAIAMFGEVYQYAMSILAGKAYEGVTGESLGNTQWPEKTPLVGDIQQHISKISKEDITLEDYLDFAGYGVQMGTGIPVNAVGLSLSGAGDIAQGNYLKGGLKALGWSENRAAHATGEDEE